MATQQISLQGSYYEIGSTQDDPERYNLNNIKGDNLSEQRTNSEIERCTVDPKLIINLNRVPLIEVENKKQNHSIIGHHQELKQQCDILKSIVEGSIEGLQQNEYFDQVASLIKQLAEIEQSKSFREQSHLQKFQSKIPQSQLNQDIKSELQRITEIQKFNKSNGILIEINESPNALNQQKKLKELEQRMQTIERVLGIEQMIITGKGHDISMNYKGLSLFTNQDSLGKKSLSFSNFDQGISVKQQPNLEPMRLLQHIQFLEISLGLLTSKDSILQQIDKTLQLQKEKEVTKSLEQIQNALDFGSQYEHELCAVNEVPWLVQRLQSLKQIHDQSAYLPNGLVQCQDELGFIEDQLRENSELLDLLNKSLDENVQATRDNINKFKN